MYQKAVHMYRAAAQPAATQPACARRFARLMHFFRFGPLRNFFLQRLIALARLNVGAGTVVAGGGAVLPPPPPPPAGMTLKVAATDFPASMAIVHWLPEG